MFPLAALPGLLLLALIGFAVGSAILGVVRSTVVPRKYSTACCPVCQYAVDQNGIDRDLPRMWA